MDNKKDLLNNLQDLSKISELCDIFIHTSAFIINHQFYTRIQTINQELKTIKKECDALIEQIKKTF